jgi:hypothetical protein
VRGLSEQGSIIDSDEENRRFMADFDDQSVFDWDALPVRSMYEGEEGEVWSPESQRGCRTSAFASTGRTETWVASARNLTHGQDARSSRDERYQARQEREMKRIREEGLRRLFNEMCRREVEEGWSLYEQMKALQSEDREEIERIMGVEVEWFDPIERKTTRNTTATRKTRSKQTPATATR